MIPNCQPLTLWAGVLNVHFESPKLQNDIKELDEWKKTQPQDIPTLFRHTIILPEKFTGTELEALRILLSRVKELSTMLVYPNMRDTNPRQFGQSEGFASAFLQALELLEWMQPNEKMDRALWHAVKEALRKAEADAHYLPRKRIRLSSTFGEDQRACTSLGEVIDARALLLTYAKTFSIPDEVYEDDVVYMLFEALTNADGYPDCISDDLSAIATKNESLHNALLRRLFLTGEKYIYRWAPAD